VSMVAPRGCLRQLGGHDGTAGVAYSSANYETANGTYPVPIPAVPDVQNA